MTDFQSLDRYPQKWRWEHLPLHERARIWPYTSRLAKTWFAHGIELCGQNGLDPEQFEIDRLVTLDLPPEHATRWLLDHGVEMAAKIVISWQPDTAVRTDWHIFTRYWEDFCMPGSDDVVIWPSHGDWAMLYHHEEFIEFGRMIMPDDQDLTTSTARP